MCLILAGCRWNDFDVTARMLPVVPHDTRSLGTSDASLARGEGVSHFSIDETGEQIIASEHRFEDLEQEALRGPLTLETVVALALFKNPTIEAAEVAILASMEDYPQVTSLPDPQFRFLNGPTIFGDSSGSHLWRLQMQQKFPWFGKRTLWGEVAHEQSQVKAAQYQEVQTRLMNSAADAYLGYALAEQRFQLARQREAIQGETLPPPHQVGQVSHAPEPQRDELEELEDARQEAELVEHRARAIRRLNRILNREPLATLPPPELTPLPDEIPIEEEMVAHAVRHLPEMSSAASQLRIAEHQLSLAHKDFYPDHLEAVGRFDTSADDFWAPDRANIRPQLGVHLYLPLRQERRWARVRQTEWEISHARAKLRAAEKEIRHDIHELFAALHFAQYQLVTSERMCQLAQQRLDRTMEIDDRGVTFIEDPDKHQAAKRKLLAYQLERTEAEFTFRRELLRLLIRSGWPMAELDGLRSTPFVQEPRAGFGAKIRSWVSPVEDYSPVEGSAVEREDAILSR